MPKELKIKGDIVRWPDVCAYCLEKADKNYEVEKTLYYGKVSRTITIQAPLCGKHYEIASQKTSTQKMLSKIIPIISVISGIGLFIVYILNIEASFMSKFLAGLAVGFSSCAVLWACLCFFLVPIFASSEAKKVKNSVRIKHFWPPDIILYEFENIGFADKVEGLNQNNIILQ